VARPTRRCIRGIGHAGFVRGHSITVGGAWWRGSHRNEIARNKVSRRACQCCNALPGTVTREGRVASALARVAAQCECARLGQSQAHDGLAAHVDARGVVVMCKPQAVALSLQLTSASATKSI